MQKVKAFGDWLTKWFTAIVIVWAVFNYFVPQASLWGKSYTGYFLGIVLFGMGLTLTLDDFKRILTQPLMVIVGTVAHFVIMPLVAVLLCWIFRLDGALAVGVILVGCCPSGTSSNVMSYLSRGDVALDVSIGILSTLCAPFMIPLLIAVAGFPVCVGPGGIPVPQCGQGGAVPDRSWRDLPCYFRREDREDYGRSADRVPGGHPAYHRRGRRSQRSEAVRGFLAACHPGGHSAQPVRIRVGLRFLQTYVQGISEGLPLCTAESHHLRGRHAGFRFGSDFGADVVRFQSVGRGAVHVLQRLAQHFRFRAVQLVA